MPRHSLKKLYRESKALGIKFAAKILTRLIVPLPDDGHSGHNFGVKFPSALAIILAEFRPELDKTKVKFKRAFFDFWHS
jgi:hypothetical protein